MLLVVADGIDRSFVSINSAFYLSLDQLLDLRVVGTVKICHFEYGFFHFFIKISNDFILPGLMQIILCLPFKKELVIINVLIV